MSESTPSSESSKGIIPFFILASALSWLFAFLSIRNPLGLEESGTVALDYAAKFGPSFAGVIIVGIYLGKVGLGDLFTRLLHWRVGIKWYVIAFGLPIIATVIGTFIWISTQDSTPELHLAASITFLGWFLVRFFMGGGLGEELGWRGFMLPALQKRWGSIQSSILVGIAWGVWHWPAFFILPEKQSAFPDVLVPMVLFTLLCIVYSMIFTYVYNGSGSLLLVVIIHASLNAIDATMDQVVPTNQGDLIAAILLLVSMVVFIPLLRKQDRIKNSES